MIQYNTPLESQGDFLADEFQILKKRFHELYTRSQNRGIYFYSDFLNLYEQTVLYEEIKHGYTLYGGFEDAERKIAIFGTEEELGYAPTPPVCILKIAPLSQKFSEELTHRDFLGSLIGLGIKRETIGDIVITQNCGYLFCLESIAKYISDNLTKVRRTSVYCEFAEELPKNSLPEPKEKLVIVSSMRVDVAISAIYDISRTKSSALVDAEKVFINGKIAKSVSKSVELGDTISVRGYGRFKYKEIAGGTKKGRIRITCDVY